MRNRITAMALVATAGCAIGAALMLTAPAALADPAEPAPPPAPAAQQDVISPSAGEITPPASTDVAAPPDGVPHLSSPENLPPGTTDVPTQQGGSTSYLRDVWHALRNHDVNMSDALLLLAQRPLSADAAPPPGLPTGPQQPTPEPPPATP